MEQDKYQFRISRNCVCVLKKEMIFLALACKM